MHTIMYAETKLATYVLAGYQLYSYKLASKSVSFHKLSDINHQIIVFLSSEKALSPNYKNISEVQICASPD